MIGTVVGNYKVIDKIGEGGMGSVYKGVDLMLEREVAIKVLKPELASQPQVVERFRSEAVTLAKLNHPNIATLYNFFRQGDHFFMVLEYVNGTPFEKIIEAHGTMTCEQAIPLFCQMLEGIDHAHSFGIVHRDIKPGNMMLMQNGLLKVLDFGIARALGSARMTRAGHLIGTIEYMSPEQVRGMETDARSDIYSLGMVLYEMLTGRVPFASDSEFELMKAQVEQLPTPPREFAPSIPEQVEWAILCATEKDPEKRFQTAGAFSEAIVTSVKTAIQTGGLSQIDARSTVRLRPSFASGDTNSQGAWGEAQTQILNQGTQPQIDSHRVPPPTRIAGGGDSPSLTLATPSFKPTRLSSPAELSSFPGSQPRSTPQSIQAPAKSKRMFVIAGVALGGILFLFATLVLAIFLWGKPAPIVDDANASEPPVKAEPEKAPSSGSDQVDVWPSAADPQPSPAGEVDSQAPVVQSVPKPSAKKAAKNDSAARERARRSRQALDKQ